MPKLGLREKIRNKIEKTTIEGGNVTCITVTDVCKEYINNLITELKSSNPGKYTIKIKDTNWYFQLRTGEIGYIICIRHDP